MVFLDTNIFLYAISETPGEEDKRAIATALIDNVRWGTSIQVLQEFLVQATRRKEGGQLALPDAAKLVRHWLNFPVQQINEAVFRRALLLTEKHKFSYWDSAIIAAALESRCDQLITEDLSHGQVIEGVRIVNPFAAAAA
ncbi:MAG TPA: twitching motility protein PilT [Alphaproteobacteria bacterium]|nr:twitching motility protein PilT [Alphaproteobacteria bacterium]HAJ47912.1 twitching motility protein PilT [Alphaproteobacteria bacterium]